MSAVVLCFQDVNLREKKSNIHIQISFDLQLCQTFIQCRDENIPQTCKCINALNCKLIHVFTYMYLNLFEVHFAKFTTVFPL